jgi:hypothetical protein
VNAEAAFIRDAIAGEQYERALIQWSAYTRQIRDAIESGTLSVAQMEELSDLFQWGRAMLLSARAHLRDRQQALEVAAVYNPHPAEGPHSVRTSC